MAIKRLDEQFAFGPQTRVFDNLNKLLAAIEARIAPLESQRRTFDATIAQLIAVGVERMDEVFTPLILSAMARLENFGAAFVAHSATAITIGLGEKRFTLPEGEREAYIPTQYVGIAHVSGPEAMWGPVVGYDRDVGDLTVDVQEFTGAGTFADWEIRINALPDRSHAARTDNPHAVTAAQAGAYTIGEVDARTYTKAEVGALIAFYGSKTGDARITYRQVADDGWIILNDGTIGNGSSGASTRANDDTEALFALLYGLSRTKALTCTISNASPAVVTASNHGFYVNQKVVFTTTGSLPAPLVVGTPYYVIAAGFATDSFRISATIGGPAINTTSAGSGAHTPEPMIWRCRIVQAV